MAHGQGATNAKGQRGYGAGGKTAHGTDKAVRKQITRERDPRIQAAMEETRKAQEELDALIERQKATPAIGAAAGALYAAQQKKAEEELARARKREETAVRVLEPEPEPVVEYEDVEIDGLEIVRPKPKKLNVFKLQQDSNEKFQFAGTTAHMMLKAGYHISYVIEFTGIGYLELAKFPLDEEGYGWPDKEKEENDERSA